MLIYGFLIALVYLLIPSDAYAWGPGAHMSYALHALANVDQFAASIQPLLSRFPDVFLYGTIAADIILGKKFAGELYHCHNWPIAFQLLKGAQSDRQKTFIYGYLGHLSVDTVAHNFYVPYKIIGSYEAMTLRHTYWEMRFDLKMDPKVWTTLEEVAGGDFTDLDEFLEKSLKRSIFSFKTNKNIFNSLLLIQRMNKWRRAAELLTKVSAYSLEEKEVREFKSLCHEVLLEFLSDPEKARVLKADPSGKLKLLYAKEMVKDLRSYTSRDLVGRTQAKDLIASIRAHLKDGIYQPVDLPVITDAL